MCPTPRHTNHQVFWCSTLRWCFWRLLHVVHDVVVLVTIAPCEERSRSRTSMTVVECRRIPRTTVWAAQGTLPPVSLIWVTRTRMGAVHRREDAGWATV